MELGISASRREASIYLYICTQKPMYILHSIRPDAIFRTDFLALAALEMCPWPCKCINAIARLA